MGVIYVGADVHRDVTAFYVMDEQGCFSTSSLVPTRGEDLVHNVSGLRGTVHLTFEEGTQAQWLHGLLKNHVSQLVVCDPSRNKLDSRGSINDMKAAAELADLLRCNRLTEVFHDHDGISKLKEIERTYQSLITDQTRIKNKLRAICRGRGIGVGEGWWRPSSLFYVSVLLRVLRGVGAKGDASGVSAT